MSAGKRIKMNKNANENNYNVLLNALQVVQTVPVVIMWIIVTIEQKFCIFLTCNVLKGVYIKYKI